MDNVWNIRLHTICESCLLHMTFLTVLHWLNFHFFDKWQGFVYEATIYCLPSTYHEKYTQQLKFHNNFVEELRYRAYVFKRYIIMYEATYIL